MNDDVGDLYKQCFEQSENYVWNPPVYSIPLTPNTPSVATIESEQDKIDRLWRAVCEASQS